MSRDQIHFQAGMSMRAFLDAYGTEEKCLEAVFSARWPGGFECPMCGGRDYSLIGSRSAYQCSSCRYQASLTAQTIFHATKLPLTTWFLGMYFLTQSKHGISSIELGRKLGLRQSNAWNLKQKLMQVMLEREQVKKLVGRVEADDAYLGGERHGGKRGRGAPGKTPFLAAVQTSAEGRPQRIKLHRVKGFTKKEVGSFAKTHLSPACVVHTDGMPAFHELKSRVQAHEAHDMEGGWRSTQHPAFKWVNTLLGNLKASLRGTYHAIGEKHIPRYLAEFQYRYNRRADLQSLIPRLLYVAVRTPPMPNRLLKLAENGG